MPRVHFPVGSLSGAIANKGDTSKVTGVSDVLLVFSSDFPRALLISRRSKNSRWSYGWSNPWD
jgi:hypothetical protein